MVANLRGICSIGWRSMLLTVVCMLGVMSWAHAQSDSLKKSGVKTAQVKDVSAQAEALKEALHAHNPPWYDSETDSWRTMSPPEEKNRAVRDDSRVDGEGLLVIGDLLMMLFYVMIGLILGLLAYIVIVYWMDHKAVGQVKEDDNPVVKNKHLLKHLPMQVAEGNDVDPNEALKAALTANDWRGVSLWTYALALLHLDHHDHLRLRPGYTNREYLGAVKDTAFHQPLGFMMSLCEYVYFGKYDPDETEARQSLQCLETVKSTSKDQSSTRAKGPAGSKGTKQTLAGLVLGLLVLTGCQTALETHYGDTQGARYSINSLSLFYNTLSETFKVHRLTGLEDHLENADGLIYAARYQGLPSLDQSEWIESWLHDQPDRLFVLVLRGNDIAPQLCRFWAEDARYNALRADDETEKKKKHLIADALEAYAVKMEQRSANYIQDELYNETFGFGIRPEPTPSYRFMNAESPFALSGKAPVLWRADTGFWFNTNEPDGLWRPIVNVGPKSFVMQRQFGGSHLMVVLNGTPLLDGAMPDAQARIFSANMVRVMADTTDKWVWLNSLSRWDGEDNHPNMLNLLFFKPPFNIIFIHVLLIGLVMVGWRSLWLGRRRNSDNYTDKRFGEHIAATAEWLQRTGGHKQAYEAYATYYGLSKKAPVASAEAAVERIRQIESKPASEHRSENHD